MTVTCSNQNCKKDTVLAGILRLMEHLHLAAKQVKRFNQKCKMDVPEEQVVDAADDVADDDGSDANDSSGEGGSRKDELEISDLTEGERFITFSDAVIAIAITLLILPLMEATSEIGAEDEEQIITVQQFFAENADKVGAFFISFWVAAQFWIAHDKSFRYVGRFSRRLVLLNFLWMLGIVFLPVATGLLTSVPDRLAVVVYILTMLITNMVGGLMIYVIRSDRRVWKGHRGPGMISVVKNAIFSVFLLAALLLSLFVPAVGAYSLVLLSLAQASVRFVEWKRPDLSY